MSAYSDPVSSATPAAPLSQLAPFNEERFAHCIAYLSATKRQAISQIYAIKLNVLIDLFHVLECGKPVIGGSVAPWELGPVVREAYALLNEWRAAFDRAGRHPNGFRVAARDGGKMLLRASDPVDADDFSSLEIHAMERAWGEIGHLNFLALKHYTHGPDTFIGAAYTAAFDQNRLMDWNEIVAKWDQHRGEDHTAIRALIRL